MASDRRDWPHFAYRTKRAWKAAARRRVRALEKAVDEAPMLDVLREIVDDADPSEGFHATLSSLFMEKHGPALLARLEAMEKVVAEEREACAVLVLHQCSYHETPHDECETCHWFAQTAANIRARGQS